MQRADVCCCSVKSARFLGASTATVPVAAASILSADDSWSSQLGALTRSVSFQFDCQFGSVATCTKLTSWTTHGAL